FVSYSCPLLALHSFPTRRSSDLSLLTPELTAHGNNLPVCPVHFLMLLLVKSILSARPCAEHFLNPKHALSALHALYPIRLIVQRSEEHTSELQSRFDLVCRLLLE